MIKYSLKGVAAAAVVAVMLAATAFAAWFLLTPGEVAERLGNTTLSAAFNSENAININASQTAGGYTFTLMSIVSGDDITDTRFSGDVRRDRTYAVVAIQKADGSPFSDEDIMDGFRFYISPYVKGFAPWQMNSHWLGGGGQLTIVDGVKYVLTDTDNISMFADRGVYIGINSGFLFGEAFGFDEETGELVPNPAFDGVNILFDLPLDVSLADPVKVQEFVDGIFGGDDETHVIDDEFAADENNVSRTTWERLEPNAP